MTELVETLGSNIWVVIVVLLAATMILNTVMKALGGMFTTAARERSRREIAAYVAEGTISPEQGERLIRADVDAGRKNGSGGGMPV